MFQEDDKFAERQVKENYITLYVDIRTEPNVPGKTVRITADASEHVGELPNLIKAQHRDVDINIDFANILHVGKNKTSKLDPGQSFECNLVKNDSVLQVTVVYDEQEFDIEDPIVEDPFFEPEKEVVIEYDSYEDEVNSNTSADLADDDFGGRYEDNDIYKPDDFYHEIDNDY
ncbi:hypothetical protein IWW47_000113 [Coemansia sp. RSA 2052]|nr:hypothetical protein IWW47_000113 [Coemansia sp. RSA 2052]